LVNFFPGIIAGDNGRADDYYPIVAISSEDANPYVVFWKWPDKWGLEFSRLDCIVCHWLSVEGLRICVYGQGEVYLTVLGNSLR